MIAPRFDQLVNEWFVTIELDLDQRGGEAIEAKRASAAVEVNGEPVRFSINRGL